MIAPPNEQSRRPSRGSLWAYNVRILLGNTYWLIVTPLAAAQLVLFWNMATATSLTAARATLTIEMLAAILGAFLCAHALAPEQDGVGELVFVRPVSVERVLLLRLGAIFAFVLIVLVPAFVVYRALVDSFSIALALLGGLPSMLALSVLALAVASAARQPLIGLGTAGAFWALDLALGSYLNPLVSLHGLASSVEGRPTGELWVINKATLLGLGALLYAWNRSALGRPAAPRRARAAAKAGLLVVVLLACYVASGAAYKVAYGVRHEREMGFHARLWYQQQFSGYGPLPVARMLGPAFTGYLEAQGPGEARAAWGEGGALFGRVDITRLRRLVQEYPNSMWADNAQLDIAALTARRPAPVPWLVISHQEGAQAPEQRLVQNDIPRAAAEYQTLVDRHPESPFAPLALSERAEVGLQVLDFGMAHAAYRQLVNDYPRAKEAYRAGVALSAAYLWQGDPAKALAMARVAVRVATWDGKAEALLAAARAAQADGQRADARDLYEQARQAAEEAKARNVRNEKSPTGLTKVAVFERADAVIRASRDALAGDIAPGPAPSPFRVQVSGKVVHEGRGLASARVALGTGPDPFGFPSPFLAGPAYDAVTDQEGVYWLASVEPGRYRVLAMALPGRQMQGAQVVEGISLPVHAGATPLTLPVAYVRPAPPRIPRGMGATPARGGQASGRAGRRPTRAGGGGGRRTGGLRTGQARPGGSRSPERSPAGSPRRLAGPS